MGSNELPETLQALLDELDGRKLVDGKRWQEWDVKDLRPLYKRAKESAQAQGVGDPQFQGKVSELFSSKMAQRPQGNKMVATLKGLKEEVKRLRGRLQRRAASAANGDSGDSNDGGDGPAACPKWCKLTPAQRTIAETDEWYEDEWNESIWSNLPWSALTPQQRSYAESLGFQESSGPGVVEEQVWGGIASPTAQAEEESGETVSFSFDTGRTPQELSKSGHKLWGMLEFKATSASADTCCNLPPPPPAASESAVCV